MLARLPERGAGALPSLADGFCTEARAAEVQQFFTPRLARLVGGPRRLAGTLEQTHIGAERWKTHGAAAAAVLAGASR